MKGTLESGEGIGPSTHNNSRWTAMKKKMVKAILIIFVVISVIMIVRFYMLGNMSKTGKATGLVSGRLSGCSDKPNCVNSESADNDSHYISPLRYPASMAEEPMALKGSHSGSRR